MCWWLGRECPDGRGVSDGNKIEEWIGGQAEVVYRSKVVRAVRSMAVLCVGVVAVLVAVWTTRK